MFLLESNHVEVEKTCENSMVQMVSNMINPSRMCRLKIFKSLQIGKNLGSLVFENMSD